MHSPRFAFSSFLTLILLSTTGFAQQPDAYVPPDLEPWRQWVLQGEEFRNCPFYSNRGAGEESNHLCAWPGVLSLRLNPGNGSFNQAWTVHEAGWVALPGDQKNWPEAVSVDGRPAAVVSRGSHPFVYLEAGSHRLGGSFNWDARPGSLRVPLATGLLTLRLDGREIDVPDRRKDTVWLGERQRTVEQQEQIGIEVYRLISDGVPTIVTTRVMLNVSGPGREEVLGNALLPGHTPMQLHSALPARLESDGRLRVQVRPGNWQLTLISRAGTASNEIARSAPTEHWPAQEIWSYQPDNRLRVSAAEAASPVDPSQVDVPGEWRNFAAFRLSADQSLRIIERQRGLSDQDANRLTLDRKLWLDFDGKGYTAQDVIRGQMSKDWRLDMLPPYRLASVRNNQTDENLLVTEGSEPDWTGVELRQPNISIETVSRIEDAGSSLAASGWNVQFDNIRTTLSLPPGYRLLAAPGADHSGGAWLQRWRLLDVFLVLLIAVAAGRMVTPAFGGLVLVMMTLTYQEVFAPVWSWLNLLIAIALAQVAPEGRFRTLTRRYRAISFLTVLVIALPFAANQVRMAMFPQLEHSKLIDFQRASFAERRYFSQGGYAVTGSRIARVDVEGPSPVKTITRADIESSGDISVADVDRMGKRGQKRAPRAALAEDVAEQGLIEVTGSRITVAGIMDRYAANTLLQTGPGKPQWSWNNYQLRWSGPVLASESFRLVIMPSWLTAIWRVASVLLLALVLLGLVRRNYRLPGGIDKWMPGKGSVAILLVALLAAPGTIPTANADIPDQALLEELKQRLTENPECAKRCAEYSSASVTVGNNRVDMILDVQAIVNVAVPLPGSGDRWEPTTVRVDGQPRRNILRTPDGVMWIELDAGVHQVRLSGPLNANDSQELFFSKRPHRVELTTTGWDASGVVDGKLLAGSIGLTRIRKDGEKKTLSSDRFPTFVRVNRQINFNLDWTIWTKVQREAPATGSITIEIPLLDGESVISEHIEIRDGKVIAALPANGRSFGWRSRLERVDAMQLTATAGSGWTETWQLTTSPTWHIDFSGVPEVRADTDDSYWVAEFDPLPGETLSISVSRPTAIAGDTLAIDNVQLTSKVGKRSASSTLEFSYRSTQGEQHTITLPADAEVTRVMVDGRPLQVRPENGLLPLSIEPGSHQVTIDWRDAQKAGSSNRTAMVNLNTPASNIHLKLQVPENRWILYTGGPALGPAVLYWPALLLMIAIALGLAKIKRTPLRRRDWVLLGLGLSTFSWGTLMLMAAWLFVMDYQQDIRDKLEKRQFNLLQAALGIFSVVVLVQLLTAVPDGLLGTPDMQIIDSDHQDNTLNWFADQSDGELPTGNTITAPMWLYKVAILLWALWLSFALIRWIPWAWRCYSRGGLWKGKVATTQG
ncbi:MAG: hypothetical protein IIA76_04910 [Proteobacteria bacterium]|nr:hypothetical protein [Pseudomonadota bacterium]